MKALFITGTGTGVGKSVVTGCLARYLQEKGQRVATQKWVQTGSKAGLPLDIKRHLKFMGKSSCYIKDHLDLVAPYKFKTACSPHLAARLDKRSIRKDKIVKAFKRLSSCFDFVLVEGTGGVLVPFNTKETIADIVRALELPVLVVAENKLGAINHTLLTLEALKRRGLRVLGVVFNNLKEKNKKIIDDNPRIVEALSGYEVLGVLPRTTVGGHFYRRFLPIGDKIWRYLA